MGFEIRGFKVVASLPPAHIDDPWTDIPLDTDSSDRDPLDKDPLDRDPQTETRHNPKTETP